MVFRNHPSTWRSASSTNLETDNKVNLERTMVALKWSPNNFPTAITNLISKYSEIYCNDLEIDGNTLSMIRWSPAKHLIPVGKLKVILDPQTNNLFVYDNDQHVQTSSSICVDVVHSVLDFQPFSRESHVTFPIPPDSIQNLRESLESSCFSRNVQFSIFSIRETPQYHPEMYPRERDSFLNSYFIYRKLKVVNELEFLRCIRASPFHVMSLNSSGGILRGVFYAQEVDSETGVFVLECLVSFVGCLFTGEMRSTCELNVKAMMLVENAIGDLFESVGY